MGQIIFSLGSSTKICNAANFQATTLYYKVSWEYIFYKTHYTNYFCILSSTEKLNHTDLATSYSKPYKKTKL